MCQSNGQSWRKRKIESTGPPEQAECDSECESAQTQEGHYLPMTSWVERGEREGEKSRKLWEKSRKERKRTR